MSTIGLVSSDDNESFPAEFSTTRASKRKRSSSADDGFHSRGKRARQGSISTEDSDPDPVPITLRRDGRRQRLQHIQVPGFQYPKSLYETKKLGHPKISELEAIAYLLPGLKPARTPDDDHTYLTLSNFRIYRPLNIGNHPGTLAPLNDLRTKFGSSLLLFDGILCSAAGQRYVEAVPFDLATVDGYDEETISVRDGICIQSKYQAGTNIWYKLAQPATDYARFYEPYLWLADFCKHFVCYLLAHDNITLDHFRKRFLEWLLDRYGKSPAFQQWLSAYGRSDFATVVAAHYEYLWKESTSLDVEETVSEEESDIDSENLSGMAKLLREHTLWKEIDPEQLNAAPYQDSGPDPRTLVTPYVYNLFKDMYFGDQLRSTQAHNAEVPYSKIPFERTPHAMREVAGSKIKIGDIVCVGRDEDGHWKDNEELWFAYVHDLEYTEYREDAETILHVFWLYRPSETTCGTSKYPYPNELFFSDHCNCNCEKAARLFASDIQGKIMASLFAPSPELGASHFIRTTYITENDVNHYITLEKEHLTCEHRIGRKKSQQKAYTVGDTVLVETHGQLEPRLITALNSRGKIAIATLRILLRKGRDLGIESALDNELVLTDSVETIPVTSICRQCFVRKYSEKQVREKQVSHPYDYRGVGDCWILTCQLSDTGILSPLNQHVDLKWGFDPAAVVEGLPTLDLFCGSGSFGRGLEIGNAAKIKWSVDIDKHAIHTTRANAPVHHDCFHGSAVEYFERAATGRFGPLIAPKGSVGMIIAGSPCQGFSVLQPATGSDGSRRNASMVALVIAFIDLYRPEYALLENVFGMLRKLGPNKDEDVFAQIVCALVGMGYQVRYFQIDAFSHGSPQYRRRIFISIAAAGLTPIEIPAPTHAAPVSAVRSGIGRSLAGVEFGKRLFDATPFPFVTAAKATQDLPNIGDGAVLCIPFPDHRLSRGEGLHKRLITRHIPRFPQGQGFASALPIIPPSIFGEFEQRVIRKNQLNSKIKARVKPSGVFDTIVTAPSPDDTQNGRWLHWDRHTIISIMEARRAQGFPDETVLIGLPSQQWKLVGNAVCFLVAVALGLSLGRAVEENTRLRKVPQVSNMVPVSSTTNDDQNQMYALHTSSFSSMKAVVVTNGHTRITANGMLTKPASIETLHHTPKAGINGSQHAALASGSKADNTPLLSSGLFFSSGRSHAMRINGSGTVSSTKTFISEASSSLSRSGTGMHGTIGMNGSTGVNGSIGMNGSMSAKNDKVTESINGSNSYETVTPHGSITLHEVHDSSSESDDSDDPLSMPTLGRASLSPEVQSKLASLKKQIDPKALGGRNHFAQFANLE